ncbi:MAG: hypothetical protein OEY79_00560, partial [Anaplasmataceae bacterium]|nr:hypothetical protein [Anaplasmataceae bacterium]
MNNLEEIKDIRKLNKILIIVYDAPNYGHQKAAITLMQRLRELGFKGVFDIYYTSDATCLKMKTMISELKRIDEGVLATDPNLGKIKMNSMESFNRDKLTEKIELVMSAACDDYELIPLMVKTFQAN